MQSYRRFFKLLLPIFLTVIFSGNSLIAATIQVPDWYNLSAHLVSAPEMGKPVELKVKLQALIGTLQNSQVRLILPDTWTTDRLSATINLIKEGQAEELTFSVTPASFLNQASIVVEAVLTVPQKDLTERINKEFSGNAANGLIESVKSWPPVTKRYADISFAMLEEESFYPLSGDMWLTYDDKLSPEAGFKGPAYFEDPMITAHQAQTDVEMFEKLENYLKSDPQLIAKLVESGIDIGSKRRDQLSGLYVLAAKAYQDKSFDIASGFLERLESQFSEEDANAFESLKIAAANLRGLVFWSQGNRRLAEETLKKAFYSNRKNPIQRYVLRNIGLLMLGGKDRDTAAQMFKLAADMKQGYTLLEKEINLVKKN